MTVPITGNIEAITGTPDNEPWVFSTVLRITDDNRIITGPPKTIQPVAGVLTAQLNPGLVIVQHRGSTWRITVPETAADLGILLKVAVGVPPDTSADLLTAAVDSFMETNPDLVSDAVEEYMISNTLLAVVDGGNASSAGTLTIDGGSA